MNPGNSRRHQSLWSNKKRATHRRQKTSRSLLMESLEGRQMLTAASSVVSPGALVGMQMLYAVNDNQFDFNDAYTVNNAGSIAAGSFDRVAYFVELGPAGNTKWVWASMDAFNTDPARLGVPKAGTNIVENGTVVSNLKVESSANSGVAPVTGAGNTGIIEFWASNYNQNGGGLFGSSDANFDWKDSGGTTDGGHGSFQVFAFTSAAQTSANTIFGITANGGSGIGNQNPIGTGNTDWTFGDGTNTYAIRNVEIWVGRENKAPVLSDLHTNSFTYTPGVGATPVVIDQGTAASAIDPAPTGSAGWNTGNLTVSIASGGVAADDRLAVLHEGTGAGQIGFAAGSVSYEGTVIGTASGGTGGTNLVITFNAAATDASVSALLNNITYQNVSATTATTARQARFTLSDGYGVTSTPSDVQINISAVSTYVWDGTGDGSTFASATNWVGDSGSPDANDIAIFRTDDPGIVDLGGTVTVGQVHFDGAGSYTLQGGTLNVATINQQAVATGTNEIAAQIGSLTFSGLVSGSVLKVTNPTNSASLLGGSWIVNAGATLVGTINNTLGPNVQLNGGTARIDGQVNFTSGLLETVYGANNIDTPTAGAIVAGPSVQSGPRAGVVAGNALPWTYIGDNETIVYTGQFFDADGVFAFAEQVDDATMIRIDGVQVLRDTTWNVAATTGRLALTPGWHDIEIRFANGGGGAGPSAGGTNWSTTKGFGLNNNPPTNPFTSIDGNDYTNAVLDPGNMSIFRVATFVPGSITTNFHTTANSTLQLGTDVASLVTSGQLRMAAGTKLDVTSIVPSASMAFGSVRLDGSAELSAPNQTKVTLSNISETAAANLTFSGNGNFVLPTANTYTGLTTINSGVTVDVTANNALGTAAAGTVIQSGGSLRLSNVVYSTAEPLTINGNGTASSNAGLLSLVGNNDFHGAITVGSGARIRSAANNLRLFGQINTGAANALELLADGQLEIWTGLSGGGAITKTGGGRAIMLGNADAGSTFSGQLNINGGVWDARGNNSLGTTAGATIINSGRLEPRDGAITLNDNITINNRDGAGSIRVENNNITLGGTITATVDTLIWVNPSSLTINGQIVGGKRIEKGGAGLLSLKSANTISQLDLQGGTVRVGNQGALGSTTGISIDSGEALEFDGNFAFGPAYSTPLTTLTVNNGAINSISGTTQLDSAITLGVTGGITFGGAGNLVINNAFGNGNAPTTSNLLNHYGYHVNNDGVVMDLNNNGGMVNGNPPNPSAYANFRGTAPLASGPGGRGLDFNDDNDFINTGAIGQADNYSNLFIGVLQVPATAAGIWRFQIAFQDDPTGIWIDLDKDGVFESSTAGLGSNRTEQLAWNDTGEKSVTLAAGDYLVAFTHREGGGGSQIDARFRSPNMTEYAVVKPLDPAQLGLWRGIAAVTPSNNVIKVGTGTTTLLGANTYNGTTIVGAGTLVAGNSAALGLNVAGTTISNGATLALAGNVAIVDEPLTVNGTGAAGQPGAIVNLSGNNAYTGTITAFADSAGTIAVGSTAGTLTLNGAINLTNSQLVFNGAGDVVVNSAISGLGVNTVLPGISETLWELQNFPVAGSAQNDIQGIINTPNPYDARGILTGHLSYPNNAAFRTRALALNSFTWNTNDGDGWTGLWITNFTPNESGVWQFRAGTIDNDASFWIDTSGNPGIFESTDRFGGGTCCAGFTGSTPTLVAGQTYRLGIVARDFESGNFNDLEVKSPTGSFVDLNPSALPAGMFSFTLVTNNAVVKNGAGTVTLAGNNTYNGATTVNAGTLVVANAAALGANSVGTTVNSGGTLGLSGGITLSGETLTLNGTGAPGQPGALANISGNNTIGVGSPIVAQVVSLGQIGIGSTVDTLMINSTIDLKSSQLIVNGAGATTINGVISGAGANVPISPPENAGAASGVFTNVPEANGYILAYELNAVNSVNGANAFPYTRNNAATIQPFNRIAYYLELQTGAGAVEYVYASMDAFTTNVNQIGVPSGSTLFKWQQRVNNLNVFSNRPSTGVGAITTGTGLTTGNIEIWPSDYGTQNDSAIPNANGGNYDFGDGGSTANLGYGSFQIHNHDIDGAGAGTAGQVILAYNNWRSGNGDLGIGNAASGNPDYTFANNLPGYTVKRMAILVRENAPREIQTNNALVKNGAGTLTLNAANTYNGATTINAGILNANILADGGVASSLGQSSNAAGNLVLDGGTLRYVGATPGTTNRLFTLGAGGGTLESAGTTAAAVMSFTNTGAIAFTGSGARTLTLSGSHQSVVGGAGEYNAAAAPSTLASVLGNGSGGNVALVKSGTGVWAITNANTYAGGTAINAGHLALRNSSALGTGDVNVAAGAQLALSSHGLTIANNITLNGLTTYAWGGQNLRGALVGDNLSGGGTNTLTGNLVLNATSNVSTSWSDKNLAIAGQISGPGALQVDLYRDGNQGPSVNLIRSASANTLSGGTILNSGILRVGTGGAAPTSHVGAFGTGTVTINAGAQAWLWIQNNAAFTIANNFVMNGGALHNEDGNYTMAGQFTFNTGSTLSAKYTGKDLTIGGRITGSGPVTIQNINVDNGGAVVFTNTTNDYTANTVVTHQLRLGAAGVIPDGAGKGNVALAGTLNLNGFAETINGLTGGGTVTNNGATAATLTVGANDQSSSFTGLIQNGTGVTALTKVGAGTLSLGNAGSTFTGNLTISGGRVDATAGHNDTNATSALGHPLTPARQILVGSGTTLGFAANDVLGNAGALPTTPIIVSGGTVTNNGAFFNTLGPVTLNGGALTAIGGANASYQAYRLTGTISVIGTAPSTISSTGANSGYHLHAPTTFDVANVTANSNADLLVSASLLNQAGTLAAASLTKLGAGTLSLSGASSYSGATNVNAGTLLVANTTGFATGTSTVTVANIALLAGNGSLGGDVTVNGTLRPGADVLGSIGTLAISGTLTLASNSIYRVDVPSATSDLVTANVVIIHPAANLDANVTSGIAQGTQIILLDAATSASGQFATGTPNSTYPLDRILFFGSEQYHLTNGDPANRFSQVEATEVALVRNTSFTALGNASFNTNEDVVQSADLVTSDADQDVQVTITNQPGAGRGTVTVNQATGVYTYTPPLNFSGTATFTYQVSDGETDFNQGPFTVTINVTPVADVPNLTVAGVPNPAAPISLTVGENQPLALPIVAALTDTNPLEQPETLSVTISGLTPDMTLTVPGVTLTAGQSSYTFTSASDITALSGASILKPDNGNYTLTISATSRETALPSSMATRTATVNVSVVNVAPTPVSPVFLVNGVATPIPAIGSTLTIVPGTPLSFSLAAIDQSAADSQMRFVMAWGDAAPQAKTVAQNVRVNFSYDYATRSAPNSYALQLTVQDDDGGVTVVAQFTVALAKIATVGGEVFVGGTTGADRIVVQSGSGGIAIRYNNILSSSYSGSRVVVFGNAGNDTITVTGAANVPVDFYGGAGNDYLAGSGLNDLLDGGEGTDRLLGGNGDDLLYGGASNDTLSGGVGDDTLYGDSYLDANREVQLPPTLQQGKDNLSGDIGDDTLYGEGNADVVNGGVGSDLARGGDGNDTVNGDDGDDTLTGDAGTDKLYGRAGNDVLLGGLGLDSLYGGTGEDLLFGNAMDGETDETLKDIYLDWFGFAQASATQQIKDASRPVEAIADLLYGEGGRDWYLLYITDKVAQGTEKPSDNTIEKFS